LYKLCKFPKGKLDFFESFYFVDFLVFFAIPFSAIIKSFSALASAITLGLEYNYGISNYPFLAIFQSISSKNLWALISSASYSPEPRRLLGLLYISLKIKSRASIETESGKLRGPVIMFSTMFSLIYLKNGASPTSISKRRTPKQYQSADLSNG